MLCMHIIEAGYKIGIFPFRVYRPLVLLQLQLSTRFFELPFNRRFIEAVKTLTLCFLMFDNVINFKRCWTQEKGNVGISNDDTNDSEGNEAIDGPISVKPSCFGDEEEEGHLPCNVNESHHTPHHDRASGVFIRCLTSG